MDGNTQVNFVSDVPQRQRHDFRSDFNNALQGAQAAMMNSLIAASGNGGASQKPGQMHGQVNEHDAPEQSTGAGALVWRQAQPPAVAEQSETATDAELVANLAMVALFKMATDAINGRDDQQTGNPEGDNSAMMPTNWADVSLAVPDSMLQPLAMDGGPRKGGTGRVPGLSRAVESTGGTEGGRHGGKIVQTIRELVEEGKRGREFGAAVSGVARSRGAEASRGRAGGAAGGGEGSAGAGGPGGIGGPGGGGGSGGGGLRGGR
jgi:hypothetical protein